MYHPTKLAAIVDMLVADGVELTEALAGVGVSGNELHSPDMLVSVEQVMAGWRNAIRLSSDPRLAFRVGLSMHVSVYGMYGYAILCSADFRKTMDFCVKYHVLATPLVALSFAEQDQSAIWTIDPIIQSSLDDRLYRFIVEMQLGAADCSRLREGGDEAKGRVAPLEGSRDTKENKTAAEHTGGRSFGPPKFLGPLAITETKNEFYLLAFKQWRTQAAVR